MYIKASNGNLKTHIWRTHICNHFSQWSKIGASLGVTLGIPNYEEWQKGDFESMNHTNDYINKTLKVDNFVLYYPNNGCTQLKNTTI